MKVITICVLFVFFSEAFANDNYGIPRKIWQTYRIKELPRPAKEASASWVRENPHYEYHFMDDVDIENYIFSNWDSTTYDFFKALPIGVMKADLWRYLMIADQGGVYADIDTVCCLPIDYWTIFLGSLNKLESGKPMLFLGIEEDTDKEIIDFCQWTFMATPRHPALLFACKYIVDHWKKNGIDFSSEQMVHLTTGPTILKYALMTYFGEPPSQRASDFYKKYRTDKNLRKKINDLGVYLLSEVFYHGFTSVHLVASTRFKEGYISWTEEVKTMQANLQVEK